MSWKKSEPRRLRHGDRAYYKRVFFTLPRGEVKAPPLTAGGGRPPERRRAGCCRRSTERPQRSLPAPSSPATRRCLHPATGQSGSMQLPSRHVAAKRSLCRAIAGRGRRNRPRSICSHAACIVLGLLGGEYSATQHVRELGPVQLLRRSMGPENVKRRFGGLLGNLPTIRP